MEETDHIILKYLYKTISPQEEKRLLEWLEEKEENRRYFRSLKDIHDLGQFENMLAASKTDQQWSRFRKEVNHKKQGKSLFSRQLLSFARYAAVFLLGLICFGTVLFISRTEGETPTWETVIETGIGERSKITLPDGSGIWINSCSAISYNNTYGEKERSVRLKGEAYFEVNTDTVKPFLVHADIFTYRVTGTSFNVYSFDNENEVSIALLEGGVTIEFGNTAEKLSPGEAFTYNKTSGEHKRSAIDVNRLSSWRNGELIFENMTFEELAKRLERSFNVQFAFENEKVKKESLGGSFHNYESLETIMKVISSGVLIKYEIKEDIVYIR